MQPEELNKARAELQDSIDHFEKCLSEFLERQQWKGKYSREDLQAIEAGPLPTSIQRLRGAFACSRNRLKEHMPEMREDGAGG